MNDRLLTIYLRDHFGGSMAGLQLARRTLDENRGNPVGSYLSQLVPQLEEERSLLADVLLVVGASPPRLKQAGGWMAERLGRLKLNGRLLGYSSLSRLVELEGLCLGVEGSRSLWLLLSRLGREDGRLAAFNFDQLVARKERQREALERLRLAAADVAFLAEGPRGLLTLRKATSEA
jgi:hypothetical protein